MNPSLSKWKLAEGVNPRFQVYDEHGNHIAEETDLLEQPKKDEKRSRNEAVIFLSPLQSPGNINYIQNEKRHKIKLLLRRHDGYESSKFDFQYIQHMPGFLCPYCDLKVDGAYTEKLPKDETPAKPNNTKRTMIEQEKAISPKKLRMSRPDSSGGDDSDSSDGSVSSSSDSFKETWNLANEKSTPEVVRETGLPELGPMLRNDPDFNFFQKSVNISKDKDRMDIDRDLDLISEILPFGVLLDENTKTDSVKANVRFNEDVFSFKMMTTGEKPLTRQLGDNTSGQLINAIVSSTVLDTKKMV